MKLFNAAVAISSSFSSYGLMIMVQMSLTFKQSKKPRKEKGEHCARLSYLFTTLFTHLSMNIVSLIA
ncbi:hypothetical protein OFN53_40310, partial [Escherichia coli]|nr:hypothetical protein [Escherichia coli]